MSASTRAREAALLVHGLPDAARAQVLARLTVEERAQVEPLLAELASLGIPKLPYDEVPARPAAPDGAEPIDRVSRLQAAQVLHGLRECGAATTAQVLGIAEWPWKVSALAGMDPARRELVMALGGASARPPAPRLAEFLCVKLLVDAEGAVPSVAAARPRAGLRRWFAWKQ